MIKNAGLVWGWAWALACGAGAGVGTAATPAEPSFAPRVIPLFDRYCYGCHGEKRRGDLDLRDHATPADVAANRPIFERVLRNLRSHDMPPAGKPKPSADERELMVTAIESALFQIDCDHPDPGRVTLRRLNRTEYNNTIRDLVGVDFKPAADFPADDLGYGFDNIGDVLSLPPVLFEKYLAAAEKILDEALNTNVLARLPTVRLDAPKLESSLGGRPSGAPTHTLFTQGEVRCLHRFEQDGEYVWRILAHAHQAGSEPARMELRLDDKPLRVVSVEATAAAPQVYEERIRVAAGSRRLAVVFLNDFYDPNQPDPARRDRNLIVGRFELVGPLPSEAAGSPASYRRIMICQTTGAGEVECARLVLRHFARRAYRRVGTEEEINRLVGLFEQASRQGAAFHEAIRVPLQAILVSPHFLFRGEPQPDPQNPRAVHPVDEFALASRLSYFLWSTMPDGELFNQAQRGTLRHNLEAQVRRMSQHAKARALVDNFAAQWLQIRGVSMATPAREVYPAFDDALRSAMARETELFVEHIFREDRSVLEFLHADYTFLNERLARHYSIPGVQGDNFRLVRLDGPQRGGVLAHASVLMVTSNPTRTSPVKRGKWVLENLLGAPPPPPPANVPELKNDPQATLTGSLRQRMEQHRADPNCFTCHERMDPLGFGLENYDGVGAWRDKDGEFPIDASGKLGDDARFHGPAELKEILLRQKRDAFARCFVEKLLTYALGRGLEYYDRCAVDRIVRDAAARDYRFSSVLMGVVRSVPFQMRRGELPSEPPQGR